MQQPDGYWADGEQADYVWKVNKSLYGLKQAGRAWNKKMDTALVELGFPSLHSDCCVYIKRIGSTVILVLVYVDDLILVTNDTADLTATKAALSVRFDMKDMGEAHFILGVQIRRDRARRQLYLSQQEFVRTVLKRFNMEDCKPVPSPMTTGVKLLKNDPEDAASSEDMANVPYASAVGALTTERSVGSRASSRQWRCRPSRPSTWQPLKPRARGSVVARLPNRTRRAARYCHYHPLGQLRCHRAEQETEHHKRTKHIEIQHHYVREQVAAGSVALPYVGTENMVADVLTKPLAADRHAFWRHRWVSPRAAPQPSSSGSVEDSEPAVVQLLLWDEALGWVLGKERTHEANSGRGKRSISRAAQA